MTEIITIDGFRQWLSGFRDRVTEHRAYLTELDSAIGDADHGANMARGMAAVMDKISTAEPATVEELMKTVGMTLVSSVGGASGPLYGTFFLRLGAAAGAVEHCDALSLAAALRAGADGIVARGRAEPGDKTMIDAMAPALQAMDSAIASGASLVDAVTAASQAAAAGRDATEPLVARKGRASYLGERSAGHLDPGATSTALLFDALVAAVGSVNGGEGVTS
jgi:phosphoenolpyruvate---glycerone phosphotransferase subunit DhaL